MTTFAPRNADEVLDAVRWAMNAGEALEVAGTGTRRGLGRPVDAPHVLDVSALSGVLEYEPEELVLTALPGTPLAEIEVLLASRNQCFAFEPPYFAARSGTLGGAVSTALSGPRRPKAGAVRDHVLGVTAVSGRGELFKAGGKVVKNVTGYDLPKLITGSYGTLAVMTELTIKVLPAQEDTRTLIVSGQTAEEAVRTMTSVLQSTADVSGACYLPEGVIVPGVAGGAPATAFRLEGVGPSVDFRLSRLRQQLAGAGSIVVLDLESSLHFWRGIRDVAPLAGDSSASLWRISVPPARGAEVLAKIQASLPGSRAFLDWGGGLLWLQSPLAAHVAGAADARGAEARGTANADGATASDAGAAAALVCEQQIRAALAQSGGHATLIRAPAEVRRAANVFQPQPAALAALSKRVKLQFDPKRVLNPGRMYPDV